MKVGRSFMWLWNKSVNLFEKSGTHEKTHAFDESLTPAQDPAKIKGIMSLYHNNRRQEGYDFLITGHIHKAGFFQDWYCNSGCWVGLRTNFLRIQSDGQVHVYEWKDNRPIMIDQSPSFQESLA